MKYYNGPVLLSICSKHRPSSSQLQADFVFPNTWDEFVKVDFYLSQFSLVQLGCLLVQLILKREISPFDHVSNLSVVDSPFFTLLLLMYLFLFIN